MALSHAAITAALGACALVSASAANAATNNVFTVAGGAGIGFSGDGGPATAAALDAPVAVAATADGGYVIADLEQHRVRRVAPDGTISTVAGTGAPAFSGDGGPAAAAALDVPEGVLETPDGGLLIADFGNHRVRRVAPDGTISTVAGSGEPGSAGDGGPATAAQLDGPIGLALTGGDGFLIADSAAHRVRRVAPDGTITTVAGTGHAGVTGDGGPAATAELVSPTGVVATAGGGFVVVDPLAENVRRVSPAGTISTIAGTGQAGFSGDGGPATAAQFDIPRSASAAADGSLLITDLLNQRVRRISPSGRITTVAGAGGFGFSGDGGLATAAGFNGPAGVAATADGGFLVADAGNSRVRFVDAELRGPAGVIAGPRGPQGPAGPPAVSAPPAPAPERLAAALAGAALHSRPGRRLVVRFALTTQAQVQVSVTAVGRRPLGASKHAAAGAGSLVLRAPKRTGRYQLTLTATTGDGRRASAGARLQVTRR